MIGARTQATYCIMYAIFVHDMGVNYACMRHLYVKFINIVLNWQEHTFKIICRIFCKFKVC